MKNRLKIYLGYLFSLLVIAAGVYALVYDILWENRVLSKVSGIVGGVYLIIMGLIAGPLFHTCVDLEHNISEDKEPTEEDKRVEAFDIIVKKNVSIEGFLNCKNCIEYNLKYGNPERKVRGHCDACDKYFKKCNCCVETSLTTSEFEIIREAINDLLRRS